MRFTLGVEPARRGERIDLESVILQCELSSPSMQSRNTVSDPQPREPSLSGFGVTYRPISSAHAGATQAPGSFSGSGIVVAPINCFTSIVNR